MNIFTRELGVPQLIPYIRKKNDFAINDFATRIEFVMILSLK